MTSTPRPKAHTPSTPPVSAPDPSVVARRVREVIDIFQPRGIFDCRGRGREVKGESLTPAFIPIEFHGEMLSESEILVSINFVFMAFGVRPDAPVELEQRFDAKGNLTAESMNDLRLYSDANFIARYSLAPGPAPSEADVLAFAEINGQLTLTPYWREFLDSSLRRAGMPPIMAPVFLATPVRDAQRKTAKSGAASAKKL